MFLRVFIKEATASISGDDVFGNMKYEAGVHRVQRVPVTEGQGRVHTSTVTVAILPQPTEVKINSICPSLAIIISKIICFSYAKQTAILTL